jgi:hypothetical protein
MSFLANVLRDALSRGLVFGLAPLLRGARERPRHEHIGVGCVVAIGYTAVLPLPREQRIVAHLEGSARPLPEAIEGRAIVVVDREEHREALPLGVADARLSRIHDAAIGLDERLLEPIPVRFGGVRPECDDAGEHGEGFHQYWNPGSTTGSGGIDGGRELVPHGVMRT